MFTSLLNWYFKLTAKYRKVSILDTMDIKLAVEQDDPDNRDYTHTSSPSPNFTAVSFFDYLSPVKNQGSIGSCGSHAICSGMEMLANMKRKKWAYPLSENFHYYMVRQPDYMNTYPEDSGQQLREGMRVAKNIGVCLESVYPYDTSKYNDGPGMPNFAKSNARYWRISKYERCYSVQGIKDALQQQKAVVLGVPVRSDFIDYNSGLLSYNKKQNLEGGHAILIYGYHDDEQLFYIQNSWGIGWGSSGFADLDYDYIVQAEWFDCWAFDIEAA